jgi:hypothetical protein
MPTKIREYTCGHIGNPFLCALSKKNIELVFGVVVAIIAILFGWWVYVSMGGMMPDASTSSPTGTANTSSNTVASLVANAMYGGRFNQLLAQSGVLSAISGKGPYTVFVPTDGAFSRLVPGTINSMSAAELKRTMQYHIVSGKSLDIDGSQ